MRRWLRSGAAATCILWITASLAAGAASAGGQPSVAPYMEMTGPNAANLSAGIDHGLTSVTAAFVLGRRCTPVWDDGSKVATNHAVAAAISAAQARGVDVVVSFGGAAGHDLARTCTDVDALTDAYQSVIVRFGVTKIDFDVEGAAIQPGKQQASIARRFAAIRALESEDPDLVVSTTIGVGPSGLPKDQLSFLTVAERTGTRIDLVNIMAMDYGGPVNDMGATAVQAAQNTMAQVRSLWPGDGYANLGITPMIGRNDSAGEVTSLADARTITAFAVDNGVGRLAYWSVNRDQQCGGRQRRARDDCSGVRQAPLEFADAFLGSSAG